MFLTSELHLEWRGQSISDATCHVSLSLSSKLAIKAIMFPLWTTQYPRDVCMYIFGILYQINTYCYLQCHGAIFKSNSKINQAEKNILIYIPALPALFQPRRNFFMQLHIEFNEGSTTFWLLILPINLKAFKHHVFSSSCNGTQHEMLVQPLLCYNNLITSSHSTPKIWQAPVPLSSVRVIFLWPLVVLIL